MVEILGNDIGLAVLENGIEATIKYKSDTGELHVWELDNENFEKLSGISEENWKSEYGWWRQSRCIYEGFAEREYIVNGKSMNGYINDKSDYVYTSHKSFIDWLSNTFNLGTEKNLTAFATSLASDNGLTLAEFMNKYQG